MSNDIFPNGWGNDEDEDYSNPFGSDNDDYEDESSPWAAKKAEQKSDETSIDNPAPTVENDTGSIENTADNPVKFTDNISNTPPQQFRQPINNYQHQPQKSDVNKVLIAVIAPLAAALVGGGAFVLINFRKDKDDKPDSDSVSTGETSATSETESAATGSATENTTAETTFDIETTVMTEIDAEKTTETPVNTKPSVNIPCSKSDVNSSYINIINSMDFAKPNKGFIFDLDNDGVNEMIIPDANEMCYTMYYFDDNSIKSCSFGNFMALDNFVMYKVNGEGNENYIYYRDNYSYKSLQGYYALTSGDELNIFIDYPEKNGRYSADWTIDFNKNENYAEGNEPVDTFYGQPSDCHNKLLSAFKNYGFDIVENSKYTEIKGLYYDELIDKLSNKTNVTQKPTEKKPSISAYLDEISYYPMADGIDIILHVSGDYSYYHYEGYYSGGGVFDSLCASGDTSEPEVLITSGSTISSVKVDITPYNTNNTAGETISVSYTVAPMQHHVEVNSCNLLGQINTYGEIVAGYATSYVVDGGAVSEIRHSLGDGWHITAKNMCVNYGVTWYELWDSDDGDYYGWVDSNYVDLDL